MKKYRKRVVPVPLILIFVLAVLVPSIALSFLALRAADRESLFVERRLEGALLAETDLAARKVEELMAEIQTDLEGNAFLLDRSNPLVDVPFILENGRLSVADAPPSNKEIFMTSFGAFLRGDARLPLYDSIARVYRKEMQPPPSVSYERLGSAFDAASVSSSYKETDVSENERQAVVSAPTAASPKVFPNAPSVSRKKAAPGGIERQLEESRIASDPVLREDAFRKAELKGFEISQRNVAPQKQQLAKNTAQDERSKTVSQSRTFGELLDESSGGLLPRLGEQGLLSVLFWTRRADGKIVGCTLNMEAVRQRAADVLPDVLSKVRILTVLDERGNPIVAPRLPETQEWRRPFVAREISPVLPRWEVGVWLVDPEMLSSQARFAALAVWVLVAVLFFVMLLGSGMVFWMLSSEMRVARQKTTFVANVSHELKTPLTSIRLFAELLLSGKQGNEEKRREYLRTMVSEVDRLSRLVENVLTFAKQGKKPYSMQFIDLADLTAETVGQLEPHLTQNGFAVSVRGEASLPVRGNREALRQVIMNLLSNAEKYSGETRDISVSCGIENGFAVVGVADRGFGIEPRVADKIFQEFFRGDESLSTPRSGAGLGLSIAREIARAHGGDIFYRPRDGGGSLFLLKLPVDAVGETRKEGSR